MRSPVVLGGVAVNRHGVRSPVLIDMSDIVAMWSEDGCTVVRHGNGGVHVLAEPSAEVVARRWVLAHGISDDVYASRLAAHLDPDDG